MSSYKSIGGFFFCFFLNCVGHFFYSISTLSAGHSCEKPHCLETQNWQVMPLDVTEPGSNRVAREPLGKHPRRVLQPCFMASSNLEIADSLSTKGHLELCLPQNCICGIKGSHSSFLASQCPGKKNKKKMLPQNFDVKYFSLDLFQSKESGEQKKSVYYKR